MIHSFNQVNHANGNVTVEFFDDNKRRQIIFQKGTIALEDYTMCGIADIYQAIISLREKYLFKANANNPSIFRPIEKSLILNN